MPDLNLTQNDLNQSLRGLTAVEIMSFLPDKDIYFPSNAVTVNKQSLPYTSRLQSIIELSSVPQPNLATFENNSWILDGSFISPSAAYGGGGNSYSGYISNDMTDDNGDYTTNPILTVSLSLTAPKVEYLSIRFAGGIDTSYPKTFKIRTYGGSSLIREHEFDMASQTGLPLLVAEIGDENVDKVEFEFVGTVCPHRRSRLNKIMFGKVELVDPHYLQSWSIDDKASLVADSIPTKTLTYSIINYERDYDVDNPGNKIPINYKDVLILFTLSMEQNGLWKYMPTKTFNLLNISTTSEGIVTFECGSLLDMLTDTYDSDIYNGERTIQDIMKELLTFSEVGTDQCILNEFGDYKINIPLPQMSVREIIQRLAFSCGATLTVDDDNRIIFSKKSVKPNESTPKFMFHRPEPFNSAGVLLQEPTVEALENTTNIAMYTYDTTIDEEASELGTIDVSIINSPVSITYSACVGAAIIDEDYLEEQHAHLSTVYGIYSQHAQIALNTEEEAILPIKVRVSGRKANTTQIMPRNTNADTLLLDSGLAKETPSNLISGNSDDIFYYSEWYGAKYKYKCKTRKEYLIKAGDIIYFETPFTDGKPTRIGYVLRNSYSNSNDSGEMEVVVYA